MKPLEARHIHCVGVGGIGISAIARLFLEQKKRVSGSDVEATAHIETLKKAGLLFFLGHASQNLPPETGLLLYSAAVPEDNPERAEARRRGITELSYPEVLGLLSQQYETIAIAGTHGKSTITALAGLLFEAAGLDPTVIVGSLVTTFPFGNLRIGRSQYLIVEACEYRAHFLHLKPKTIILNNVERDHLDYYRDENMLLDAFQAFADSLPKDGTLILNAADEGIKKLKRPDVNLLTYGLETEATAQGMHRSTADGRQQFRWSLRESEGIAELRIPGGFNVTNALAVLALSKAYGIDTKIFQKTAADFSGIWRRFERLGEWNGAELISDYAHHPTAVRETLKATKEFFPSRRIVLVFQPHQRNRTQNLFTEFTAAFDDADVVILNEIYDVAGREEDSGDVNSEMLADAVRKRWSDKDMGGKNVIYSKDIAETETLLRQMAQPNDVVIIMGAGDIVKVGGRLNSSIVKE